MSTVLPRLAALARLTRPRCITCVKETRDGRHYWKRCELPADHGGPHEAVIVR